MFFFADWLKIHCKRAVNYLVLYFLHLLLSNHTGTQYLGLDPAIDAALIEYIHTPRSRKGKKKKNYELCS